MSPPIVIQSAQWVADSFDRLEEKVEEIHRNGCNQREGDLKMLEMLNEKMDDAKINLGVEIKEIKTTMGKIYLAVIGILLSGLGYILEQLILHRLK